MAITWQDYQNVGLCVGTIVRVEEFPAARNPAYKVWVDLGDVHGIQPSSAQITRLYTPAELLGKQVICVTGFPPKQIGPFISTILITGFHRPDGAVALATPDFPIPNGTPLL